VVKASNGFEVYRAGGKAQPVAFVGDGLGLSAAIAEADKHARFYEEHYERAKLHAQLNEAKDSRVGIVCLALLALLTLWALLTGVQGDAPWY
jgi:hypothetical protein